MKIYLFIKKSMMQIVDATVTYIIESIMKINLIVFNIYQNL